MSTEGFNKSDPAEVHAFLDECIEKQIKNLADMREWLKTRKEENADSFKSYVIALVQDYKDWPGFKPEWDLHHDD